MDMPQNSFFKSFQTEKKELLFGAALLAICMLMFNSIIAGGFQLGYAIAYVLCVLCSGGYLISRGHKLNFYSAALLVLSMITATSFARADDAVVKLVMFLFMFISTNLGLCLLAKKNQFRPSGLCSVLDAFTTQFGRGFGELPASYRGLFAAFRRSGTLGQKTCAILVGLGITVPVMLIIIPLLIQADAAFEGLLKYLPEFSVAYAILTVIFGSGLACVLYTRNTALHHGNDPRQRISTFLGISPLTINTVLIGVCVVYCAYLVSQLAYLVGGFAGILPEDFTLAQYARRGFFEMAWLCAINLTIMVLSLSLCKKESHAPLVTRLLCLFVGIVTLFLVATASAKMILYIESYGLTRLRVLTQVVMVFLAVVTLTVCLWLFIPKLSYMKTVMLAALIIGTTVSWIDVDTMVARYNVNSYLSGQLETVDIEYLDSLGSGAVPYIEKLSMQASDQTIANTATFYLASHSLEKPKDFRAWNYADHKALQVLDSFRIPEAYPNTMFQIAFPESEVDRLETIREDGLSYGSVQFSDTYYAQISHQMQKSDAWHAFPLETELTYLLHGYTQNNLTVPSLLDGDAWDIPDVWCGYYYFIDHDYEGEEPQDLSDLSERDSLHITLVLYDTDSCTLHYWELER